MGFGLQRPGHRRGGTQLGAIVGRRRAAYAVARTTASHAKQQLPGRAVAFRPLRQWASTSHRSCDASKQQFSLSLRTVRSVFVFPEADLDWVRAQLRRVARQESNEEWVVDSTDGSPVIYVQVERTTDDRAPLYCDWEPDAVEGLRLALGRIPEWCITGDVSGRVPGDAEVRTFVLALLTKGGVAVDDHSSHCWTASEIAEGRESDGLRFFDYRTSFQRSRCDR